jgi:hypothetical protein
MPWRTWCVGAGTVAKAVKPPGAEAIARLLAPGW